MTGGAGEFPQRPPSLDGGELLLRLLQSHQRSPSSSLSPQILSIDPAVAAVGPAVTVSTVTGGASRRDRHNSAASNHSVSPPPNFLPLGFHHHQSPPCPPPQQQFFPMAPHQHFDLHGRQYQPEARDEKVVFGNFSFPLRSEDTLSNSNSLENNRENSSSKMGFLRERELGFGVGSKRINGFDLNRGIDPRFDLGPQRPTEGVYGSPEVRRSGPPPGFSSKPGNHRGDMGYSVGRQMGGSIERRHRGNSSNSKGYERDRRERRSAIGDSESSCSSGGTGVRLSRQMERPGPPSGSTLHSASASEIEESLLKLQAAVVDHGEGSKARSRSGDGNGVGFDEVDELSEQLVDSVLGEDEVEEKNDTKKKHFRRDRDFRSDARGKWILPQRMRNVRRLIGCRRDIDRLNAAFIAIYESLVPPEEEKAKQKQLLTLLEKLVRKEWPNAELYLYGSCANSFGVSKSDIDVCLAIDDQNIDKSEVLLKLADILQSDNLQNVQALTRARVPIVKLMDPVTGISCDICINNVLAVVNTKLLRDYAKIDVRLRQLAFIVKHWAKSRAVNETYQGTLSSYAYVLMCIHFLQQCRPPILPCLQEMEATYSVTIDDVECAYFDKVDRLRDFGARNRESIAQLVWEFFHYWAYCHDYANSVISVRAGTTLSKQAKDWTRRIGNDRHLICIEDPFETSHDLGRVVDKRSIRVLREEFERAAEILQCDPNPCFRLFERYPPKNPSLT